ncbi:hypothetical protein PR048_028595 [Dryococelus australis]|uniref:Uncharacterized protein n=1 Tax=Dryococelus australis TaxID=614101 RepID=A0ABQ9GB06_9NEOP|nr:hypothetical protein PR048_028595 [Dryococelus australis]
MINLWRRRTLHYPVSGFTETIKYFAPIMSKPLLPADIGRVTNRVSSLARVRDFTTCGWPERNPDESHSAYFTRRIELTVEEDCVVWGHQVNIPASLQNAILTLLHEEHPGATQMKMLARSHLSHKWQRIQVDLASVGGRDLLIVVDAHSKWVDIFLMRSTTAEATVAKLRILFSS